MNTLSNTIKTMAQITRVCTPLIGQEATQFLRDTLAMNAMISDMLRSWRERNKTTSEKMLELAEDNWLAYLLACQLGCMRSILDAEMISGEAREKIFPWLSVALSGMPYDVAVEDLASPESTTIVAYRVALTPEEATSKPH